jgi:hypothetical protein
MRSRTFAQAPTPRPHKPDQTLTGTGKWSLGFSHVVRDFRKHLIRAVFLGYGSLASQLFRPSKALHPVAAFEVHFLSPSLCDYAW